MWYYIFALCATYCKVFHYFIFSLYFYYLQLIIRLILLTFTRLILHRELTDNTLRSSEHSLHSTDSLSLRQPLQMVSVQSKEEILKRSNSFSQLQHVVLSLLNTKVLHILQFIAFSFSQSLHVEWYKQFDWYFGFSLRQ